MTVTWARRTVFSARSGFILKRLRPQPCAKNVASVGNVLEFIWLQINFDERLNRFRRNRLVWLWRLTFEAQRNEGLVRELSAA
jgi:hypothetical protein